MCIQTLNITSFGYDEESTSELIAPACAFNISCHIMLLSQASVKKSINACPQLLRAEQ